MSFVQLDRLTKRYGGVPVVKDVSLAIDKGQLVCLLGPSGCGKTTTLRLIAGFAEPDAGEITVGGRRISAPGAEMRLPPTRISPPSGSRKPAISRSVVVLPQPDGPSRHASWPCSTCSDTSSTTASGP